MQRHTRTVANGFLGSCARFSRWLRFQSTAPTNQPAGFGPIQPTKRAIQDASLLEQGGTEALQLDESVHTWRLGLTLGLPELSLGHPLRSGRLITNLINGVPITATRLRIVLQRLDVGSNATDDYTVVRHVVLY